MANQDEVNRDTGQQPTVVEVMIKPALIIGWNTSRAVEINGKQYDQFVVLPQGISPVEALALLRKAEGYLLRQINEHQPKESLVQPVAIVPDVRNGRVH